MCICTLRGWQLFILAQPLSLSLSLSPSPSPHVHLCTLREWRLTTGATVKREAGAARVPKGGQAGQRAEEADPERAPNPSLPNARVPAELTGVLCVQLLKKGETQQAAQKARMLLAKQAIAAQMDQAADMAELSVAQIQANNAMNRMTYMMTQSSRTMSRAQKSVNPERTLVALEQIKNQNEEYAMSNGIYQDAMTQSTSVQVSDDAVHELLGKLADDAGVELSQELGSAQVSRADPVKEAPTAAEPTAEEEDALQQRLRALRA